MSVRTLDRDAARRLLTDPAISKVLSALAVPGEETRLVGGCVRDVLLGRFASDFDLATTLHPDATVARATAAGLRSLPTGIEHGTVTIAVGETAFEVTTLREDIETDGRHAVVKFGRDFARDAERRDFTINALSVGTDGMLHDYADGIADLETGRVRFIGNARIRIREDALRILRFFRFHARYGRGAPDLHGLEACIAERAALDGLSRERVREEFVKLLKAPGAVDAISILSDIGLLLRLIGTPCEIGRLQRVSTSPWSTLCTEMKVPAETVRLAALAVFSVEDSGRLQNSLRLSKAEAGLLRAYAKAVAILHDMTSIDAVEMRRLVALYGIPGIAMALAAITGEPRPSVDADASDLLGAMGRKEILAPVFPLTGADLVSAGVPTGPEIGRRLALVKALWLEKGCPEGDAVREDLLAHAMK